MAEVFIQPIELNLNQLVNNYNRPASETPLKKEVDLKINGIAYERMPQESSMQSTKTCKDIIEVKTVSSESVGPGICNGTYRQVKNDLGENYMKDGSLFYEAAGHGIYMGEKDASKVPLITMIRATKESNGNAYLTIYYNNPEKVKIFFRSLRVNEYNDNSFSNYGHFYGNDARKLFDAIAKIGKFEEGQIMAMNLYLKDSRGKFEDQTKTISLPEFLKASMDMGVVSYIIDFEKREIIYWGIG